MDRKFSVTEPHPSVPKSGAYLARGIGGAGNYRKYSSAELTTGPTANGPASRLPLTKNYPRNVTIGRGGVGNNKWVAPETEISMFQFDEEMLARREAQAPIYHIGRGGAANFVDERKTTKSRQNSDSSNASTISHDSVRRSIEGALSKIQQRLSRQ